MPKESEDKGVSGELSVVSGQPAGQTCLGVPGWQQFAQADGIIRSLAKRRG